MHKLKIKLLKWLGIISLDCKVNSLYGELRALQRIFKERTDYHLDIHQYEGSNSQIIIIGKYKKRDFVKCYSISANDLDSLIRHCKDLEVTAKIGKIDVWPDVSAVIKHEVNYEKY